MVERRWALTRDTTVCDYANDADHSDLQNNLEKDPSIRTSCMANIYTILAGFDTILYMI